METDVSEERWPARIIWIVIPLLIAGAAVYVKGFLPTVPKVYCWLRHPDAFGDGKSVLLSIDPDPSNPIKDLSPLQAKAALPKLAGIKIIPTCTSIRVAPKDWNAKMERTHAVAAVWAFKDENHSSLWTLKAGDNGPDEDRPFQYERIPIVLAALIAPTKADDASSLRSTVPDAKVVKIFDGMLSDDTQQRRASREHAVDLGPERIPDLMSWARGKQPTTYRVALGTVYVISALLQKCKSDDVRKLLHDDDKAFLRRLQSNNNDPTFQQYIMKINSILE